MSEQPIEHTAATSEAIEPKTSDEHYGHLSIEDDPEGTTDAALLASRHHSHDEA